MEPLSNNFILTEKSSTSILLKFWGYFWLQDFRGSKKGSIYVCRNLPMSHLVQFKAWKWGFGWFSNLQAWKTWIFQISRVAHKVWWILGAPIWAPKSQKFYFHKLQKKLKIFQFYHVYSKCTSFDVQPQIPKCNQIPYYVENKSIFWSYLISERRNFFTPKKLLIKKKRSSTIPIYWVIWVNFSSIVWPPENLYR